MSSIIFATAADGKATADASRPPVAVETAKAVASDLEEAVDVVGTLTARSEAEVKTEYSGTVAEVFVTQWVRVKAGTPLARLEEPGDLVGAVVFFVSDESNFVTGQALVVDGGRYMH